MEMSKCKQLSIDLVLGRLTNPLSCEDQLLTVTVLICVENSAKELGDMNLNYSQLLAHAEARPEGIYIN